MKKEWSKPKLVVLYRGRPEENVLQFCKNGLPSRGPGGEHATCQKPITGPSTCEDCLALYGAQS